MKIDKIEIDGFGKLNNFVLELSQGFNLVVGRNESGKSTICEFLLAMFYDLPNEGKRVALSESARKKYRPWRGDSFGGRVFFTDDNGKKYILEKQFGNTKRSDRVKLVDAQTWDECGTGENLGEQLFGLSREAFLKTLYIKSFGIGEMAEGGKEVLSRLSNMETSGDEEVSYDNIKNALEKEMYSIQSKTGRGGQLPALQDGLLSLENEFADALHFRETIKTDEARLEELKAHEKKLRDTQSELLKKQEKAVQYEKYLSSVNAYETKTVLENRLKSEKSKLEEIVKTINEVTGSNTDILDDADILKAKELERNLIILENKKTELLKKQGENENHGRMKILLILLSVLVFATFFAVGIFVKNILVMSLIGLLSAAVFVALALTSRTNQGNKRELCETESLLALEEDKKRKLCEKYGIGTLDGLFDLERKLLDRENSIYNLNKEKETCEKEIDNITSSIAELKMPDTAEFLDDVKNYNGETSREIMSKITETNLRLTETSSEIYRLSEDLGRQNAKGRLVLDIQADIDRTKNTMQALTKKLSSYKKAYEWLDKAHSQIKQNYAPALNKKIGEIFEKLTNGKYDSVKVGENLAVNYQNENNEIVESGYLSQGTFDLIYISLRLAVLSLAAESKIPPVILDDAFIQLDDTRFKLTAEYLSGWERLDQVIAFTCHEKNAELLESSKINVIKLDFTEAV